MTDRFSKSTIFARNGSTNRALLLLAMAGLTLLPGCLSAHSVMKPGYAHLESVRSAEEIEIVDEAPERSHETIGEVSLTYTAKTRREKVIEILQQEAARMGADGIILRPVHPYKDKWLVTGETEGRTSEVGTQHFRLGGTMYRYLRE